MVSARSWSNQPRTALGIKYASLAKRGLVRLVHVNNRERCSELALGILRAKRRDLEHQKPNADTYGRSL